MLEQTDIKKIEQSAKEFFEKMTVPLLSVEIFQHSFDEESKEKGKTVYDTVDISIKIQDPQILIGEKGQTIIEIQRLLKTVLNKKIGKIFYLSLDINDYKKKKTEYLKKLANELADEAMLTKEEKILFPMPAYERRIIHSELSKRQDIFTESKGTGEDRHIIIKPR
ncbi:MAG: hypothetical protein HYT36_01300 [Candidatus Staskawiczbacteria bacterium]|nr:hypothetical protein [Candidatus Staskawiczbacteria bacterium]